MAEMDGGGGGGVSSRKILFCGAHIWTKAIAGINFVGSIVLILKAIKNIAKGIGNTEVISGLDVADDAEHFSTADPFGNLLGAIISLGLSILLIIGVMKEKPTYIMIWLVAEATGIGIFILFILTVTLLSPSSAFVLITILALPFGAQIFFMWVVNIYRREISDKQKEYFGNGNGDGEGGVGAGQQEYEYGSVYTY